MPEPFSLIPDTAGITGEMAQRLKAFDWASTPLGSPAQWPAPLIAAVNLCMLSRFPMFIWWGEHRINLYNDAYIPILGKRHPDAFGQPAKSIWHEIWDVVGPQAERVFKHGEATWNDRVRLDMERNGFSEETYFTWSYSPIVGATGEIDGLFCACVEDTYRVSAEHDRDRFGVERNRLIRELEHQKSRLTNVIEQSPAFMCVLRGPDHVFEIANARYYDVVGKRDLIGKPIRDALPEVEGQGFFEILDTVYQTGEPYSGRDMPAVLRRKEDGGLELRFVNVAWQALREPDGTISGVFVHGLDVTDLRESRAAFAESEARFRAAFDQAVAGMVISDNQGRVLRANDAFCRLVGYTEGELVGETSQRFSHPDDIAPNTEHINSLHSGEATSAFYEKRYFHKSGRTIYALISLSPLRNESGEITSLIGVAQDITDRKQAEEDRQMLLESERAARMQADRTSQIKDEFLATLSHELRTPLNAILGWSQIVKRSNLKPNDLAQGLDVIERNARIQAQIIEDLLDMSRIISGKVRLDVQRVDLSAIVHASIETARPAADAKGIRIQSIIDPLQGVVVNGDANRLQQILWNLLSNAIKFTQKEGRVKTLVERVNSHIEISVIDSGEGIAPEFLPYVFDRFRQADSSTTRRHGGLGIGLSIVKQLVELHGGSIVVHSAGLGNGSTFRVSLPLTVLHSEVPLSQERQHPRLSSFSMDVEDKCSEIAGLRILAVDDEPDARALVQRLLEECDAVVTTCANADEALRELKSSSFDVLVSDIGMPMVDGYELIRRVRQMEKEKAKEGSIPAVALTAFARAEDRVKIITSGFQIHVAKPVESAELIAVIASLAGRHQV